MVARGTFQRFQWVLRAGVTLFWCSCGPVQTTAYFIDTETMLAAAQTAQAPKLAPYEWTAANLYLAKAKEEVGYSDYEQATDYGKKAVDFATKARDVALRSARSADVIVPSVPVP
jgi:hypothetical protein